MDVGGVVGGRYELVALLGQGWSGATYSARDGEGGELVAVRVIKPELASDRRAVERFLVEALRCASVSCPHLAAVRCAEAPATAPPYLVMDPIGGGSLTDALRSRDLFEPREALTIARQVGEALAGAHEAGLTHLYLSPDDVFVEWRGPGNVRAVVVGFGVDQLFIYPEGEEPSITHGGTVLGVPEYMSPEQARGEEEGTPQTDLYALGIILFEMLAGRPPFVADTAFALLVQHLGAEVPDVAEVSPRADVPRAVEALIRRLLEKDPALRPPSARAVVETIDALL